MMINFDDHLMMTMKINFFVKHFKQLTMNFLFRVLCFLVTTGQRSVYDSRFFAKKKRFLHVSLRGVAILNNSQVVIKMTEHLK